tara:strand:- start:215 stop:583 length:369 start_codon:yes stop_codon:yes gene_type:complete
MNDIGSKLEDAGSKIINHIVWGKKKLAYSIKGNTYGNYILLHYEGGDNKKLNEFDLWLKLSGLVIRHMVVKLEDKPEVVEDFEDENPESDSNKKLSEQKEEIKKSDEGQIGKEKIKENKEVE